VALWFALDARNTRERLLAWAALGVACGMGFMTKGFLAWLLPVLIALPYMLWQRRLGELLRYGLVAVVVAIGISLPWVLSIHAHEPDFWRFFFWHEHIRRFAADNAQHTRPWWFYLPLLVASSLPWAALLPSTFMQAWKDKRQASTGYLLLWFLLPLAFFSLSRGKLPTYIMPCLLPLAVLMGNALIDRISANQSRAIRINSLLNLLIGVGAMVALLVIQLTRPVYGHNEMLSLSLVFFMLMGWIIANLLPATRPLHYWAAPALGIWLLVALLPAGMPGLIVHNQMPDQFIKEHVEELKQTKSLLSNDLGAASALSWRLRRPEVALYNTEGELKYGLAYADSAQRKVSMADVGQWVSDARKQGSVGIVMRVKDVLESQEVALLPPDGKRYEEGNMLILILPQSQP
jgi:4-amino-4-deoxy-L-arabinose transferase